MCKRTLLILAAALAVASAGARWCAHDPAGAASPGAHGGDRIRFNRDIRPLLSDRCFKCHGFDGNQRKAGLRLDTWEGLTQKIDDVQAVTPGHPDRSEVVTRIEDEDPDFVMPPPDSGLSLTADERALIRRWIEEGAKFEPHWAFIPSPAVEPPEAGASGARNGIDRFITSSLEDAGLALSPAADRETLVRRVTLDLTGLPPTPEEIDAFLADRSPGAWDRVIERLLASPRYGERMALMWLDAARYADTNGFHHDNERTIWPYRNWVIEAFNENLPYDRFLVEQIAGDLLPGATEANRIASAFCRLHNINDEGGAIDAEYRVEAVVDRIETISTVVMGLTMTCARCHDHKYDPLTQEDYFSLYAYFNSVDERGVYGNNFEQARAYPARLDYLPEDLRPRARTIRAQLRSAQADLAAAEPVIAREHEGWRRKLRHERGLAWVPAELVSATTESDGELVPRPDGSVKFVGETPAKDSQTFTFRTDATGLRLVSFEALRDAAHPGGRVGLPGHGNVVVSAFRAEAVSLADRARKHEITWRWAWADHEQRNGDFDILNAIRGTGAGWAMDGHQAPGGRFALLVAAEPFGFEGGTEVRVTVEYGSRYDHHIAGRTRVRLGRAKDAVLDDMPLVAGGWFEAGPFRGGNFDALYDEAFGPEKIDRFVRGQKWGKIGWTPRPGMRDGVIRELRGERTAFYFARSLRTPVTRKLDLSLGSDDAIRVYLDGREVHGNKALRGVRPDQERVTITVPPGEHLLVVKIVNNGGPGGIYHRATPEPTAPLAERPVALLPDGSTHRLEREFMAQWGRRSSRMYAPLLDRERAARERLATIEAQTVPVLVMKEKPEATPTFVLERGHYEAVNRERPVERRPPMILGGRLPDGEPENRLGLARWLVRPDHPLTARVHVNRIWQMIFGTGIVKTSENFGMQADWPSHPELLDWLAARFVKSGWDQKALVKLIVDSATYRQSAVIPAGSATADPENRLLSHFPRRRLPGEMIRDLALYSSGLMVEKLGGPSVRPYQPAGLWREVSIGGSSNTQVFRRDAGEALWRRSLYTFWKRTSPNPQMTTFDAPTREFCVVQRSTTNTPLQALVLWNDVQFLEAARALAARTLRAEGTDEQRLVTMFRRTTGRRPGAPELDILSKALADFRKRYRGAPDDAKALLEPGEYETEVMVEPWELAAWTMIGSTMLNLDETLVRD